MYFSEEAWSFVEIGMSEDVDECSLDLGEDVFCDVVDEDVEGKYLLNFFGADVIAVEGHIGKVVDLCGQSSAFSGKH